MSPETERRLANTTTATQKYNMESGMVLKILCGRFRVTTALDSIKSYMLVLEASGGQQKQQQQQKQKDILTGFHQ